MSTSARRGRADRREAAGRARGSAEQGASTAGVASSAAAEPRAAAGDGDGSRVHADAAGGSQDSQVSDVAANKVFAAEEEDQEAAGDDMKRAAAYRTKYLLRRVRLTPELLGFHHLNRDGLQPNPERCEQLLGDLLGCFDCAEADHDAVCIEEKPGSTSLRDFNKAACDHEPMMASADLNMGFGTLSHSHINQVLKNINGHAIVGSAKARKAADTHGRLQVALVASHDQDMATACNRGLEWEVLSWKMLEDEPRAVTLVQRACNKKGNVQMLEHEMQLVKRLSVIVAGHADALGRMSVTAARRKLQAEGWRGFTTGEQFRGALGFVMQLGAESAPWIKELVEFHVRCVNPKLRRIRLDILGALAEWPATRPRVRNAIVKLAYSASAEHRKEGVCELVRPGDIKSLLRAERDPTVLKAEEFLKRFHHDYEALGAYKSVEPVQLTRLLAKADITVAQPLLQRRSAIADFEAAAGKADAAIREALPRSACALLPEPLREALEEQTAMQRVERLQPLIIRYDANGAPENEQETVELPEATWERWQWTGGLGCGDLLVKIELFLTLQRFAAMLPPLTEADLHVERQRLPGGGLGSFVRVLAARDFAEGALALPCLLHTLDGISASPLSPLALETHCATQEGVLRLVPQSVWRPSAHYLPPFWLVRQTRDPEEANLQMAEGCVSYAALGGVQEQPRGWPNLLRAAQHFTQLRVPYMVNHKGAAAGTPLVVHRRPETQTLPAPKKTTRRTWRDAGRGRTAARP